MDLQINSLIIDLNNLILGCESVYFDLGLLSNKEFTGKLGMVDLLIFGQALGVRKIV